MDLGAIFLSLAVLVLVGLFIYNPFLQKEQAVDASGQDISGLLAERERILNALQELDFDNTLGKIPGEDYPLMRKTLMQQGVAILRQLDELQKTVSARDEEEILEAAIATHRVDSGDKMVIDDEVDEDIEAMIAKRRAGKSSRSAGFCAKCGQPILIADTFCPKCGNPLK